MKENLLEKLPRYILYDIGYGKKQWTFKRNKNDSTAEDSRASLYTAN